jgi:hypothetical protein
MRVFCGLVHHACFGYCELNIFRLMDIQKTHLPIQKQVTNTTFLDGRPNVMLLYEDI